MQTLSQHLNIASINTEDFLLSTIILSLELAKFCTQDCAWGVAYSIHICTLKILFQAHLVHEVNMKAVIIFFLHCPRDASVRNTYLSGYLHTNSIQELLHGKVTATDEDNETMFCHVQEFIVKSKHFLLYKGTNVTLMQDILKELTYGVMEHLSLSLSLSLSLCMFDVCARARINVCMRLCMCPNACVYVYIYVCVYVCTSVREYVCTYVRVYVTVYIYAYVIKLLV